MDESLVDVSDHMYDFAAGLLAHGVYHVVMSGRCSPYYGPVFGLHHIVHATELLMKAAIAKDHPLLIFTRLPKRQKDRSARMEFEDLVSAGQTLTYGELPDVLWAITDFRLPHDELYQEIGRLRNAVQHFAVPTRNCHADAMRYACGVTNPLLVHFWQKSVFEVVRDAWGEEDDYLLHEGVIADTLSQLGIAYDGWLPGHGE